MAMTYNQPILTNRDGVVPRQTVTLAVAVANDNVMVTNSNQWLVTAVTNNDDSSIQPLYCDLNNQRKPIMAIVFLLLMILAINDNDDVNNQ